MTRGLRTVALIKQVPLGGGTGELDADGRLRRDVLDTEMNPWCRRAVTQAVQLSEGPGGRSTAITMGPPSAADTLREALACGVEDAVHVCDPALAGSDCLVTSKALAAAITDLGEVDVILVGRSSVDGNTAAVGPMVAELLGLPFIGPALSITHDGTTLRTTAQTEDGTEPVSVTLPAVVALAERSCNGAKALPDVWGDRAGIRTVTMARIGERMTSPTAVAGVRSIAQARHPVILTGSLDGRIRRALDLWEWRERDAADLVKEPSAVPAGRSAGTGGDIIALAGRPGDPGTRALLGESAALAAEIGGRVLAVVTPGPELGRLTSWGADDLITIDHDAPRPVAAALTSWVAENGMPWAILGTARSWDREVLGRLAVRLDAGIMSDLVQVIARADEETGEPRLVGVKPSGNAAMAEIVSHGATQIATLRAGCLDLRTPRPAGPVRPVHHLAIDPEPDVRTGQRVPEHDYDALERAEVVIGIGQGVDPDHYGELLPLRTLLGAELAATRKVTDVGRLPHSRQVGVTARSIAPRLYIAFGISGNMNHMMGVTRAGTVIAVNDDPDAEVFQHCDIGIVADWREAAPRIAAELGRRRENGLAGARPGC